jgi:hypothetical protein
MVELFVVPTFYKSPIPLDICSATPINSSRIFLKVIQVEIFMPNGATNKLPPLSSNGSNLGTHLKKMHIPYLDHHGVSNRRA